MLELLLFIEVEQSLPAAGQGAVGIECRTDDIVVKDFISTARLMKKQQHVFWLNVR